MGNDVTNHARRVADDNPQKSKRNGHFDKKIIGANEGGQTIIKAKRLSKKFGLIVRTNRRY